LFANKLRLAKQDDIAQRHEVNFALAREKRQMLRS
jgi:hypothetical protein